MSTKNLINSCFFHNHQVVEDSLQLTGDAAAIYSGHLWYSHRSGRKAMWVVQIVYKLESSTKYLTTYICAIFQGMDLEEFPPLLSLGFSSPTVDTEEPLSFGTLLACLNMALSNLGPVSFLRFFQNYTCLALSRNLFFFVVKCMFTYCAMNASINFILIYISCVVIYLWCDA